MQLCIYVTGPPEELERVKTEMVAAVEGCVPDAAPDDAWVVEWDVVAE